MSAEELYLRSRKDEKERRITFGLKTWLKTGIRRRCVVLEDAGCGETDVCKELVDDLFRR